MSRACTGACTINRWDCESHDDRQESAALPLADARILIAGAASWWARTPPTLLAAGVREVILLDNFAFGTPEAIAHLQGNPRVKVVRGDLMRLPDLLAATEGVDGVLHWLPT